MNRLMIGMLVCILLLMGICEVFAGEEGKKAPKKYDLSGKILYRGRKYNLDFDSDSNSGSLNRQNTYGDLTLTMKFNPVPGVSGCFEFYKQVYGTGRMQYNLIQTGETVTGNWAENEDENWELTLMQAWGKADLPFAPASIKMGRQPIKLGNGIYVNTGISKTFAIVVDAKLPMAKLSIGTLKFYEGTREKNDDADVHFVKAGKAIAGYDLGVFVAQEVDLSSDSFDRRAVNVGVTAKGKAGPVTFTGEFDYLMGTSTATAPGVDDVDLSGMAVMAGVGLPPFGKVKVDLEGGMGTGDDPETSDKNEAYTPPAPFYPYAWAYEYRFIHWVHNSSRLGMGTPGLREPLAPGLENTIYLKASAKAKHKAFSGMLALIYLMAQQERPITDNNGQKFEPGTGIGIEIDAVLNWAIRKNFSYQFIFANVLPGSFFDGRVKGFDEANNPVEADMAWGIRSQFAFMFN